MRLHALLALGLAAAPATGAAGVPRVLADLPAVHSLVARVMAGVGTPGLLLDAGADPHDFQLRPSTARALAAADLVFWVGPDLTPGLAHALSGGGAGGARRAVALATVAGVTGRPPAALGEGTDPHLWLDPANARRWTLAIAATLARADGANATRYGSNAAAAAGEIDALAAELTRTLAPAGATPIVVLHDAYGHFAAAFGLTVAAAIMAADGAAPGARHLARTRARVAALGPVCVFPEVGQDRRLARAVIEGTAARLGPPLDPEGAALAPGPELYPRLMRGLAEAIAACAGGG